MGFRAERTGGRGFRALPTGEDVELVERFEAAGMRIHRDAELVGGDVGSTRRPAPGGFAQHLRDLTRKTGAGA
jgi:hypothetical protein